MSPQTSLTNDAEPRSTFCSLQSVSHCGCQSHVSAIWHLRNTANYTTRCRTTGPVMFIMDDPPGAQPLPNPASCHHTIGFGLNASLIHPHVCMAKVNLSSAVCASSSLSTSGWLSAILVWPSTWTHAGSAMRPMSSTTSWCFCWTSSVTSTPAWCSCWRSSSSSHICPHCAAAHHGPWESKRRNTMGSRCKGWMDVDVIRFLSPLGCCSSGVNWVSCSTPWSDLSPRW